MTPLLCVLVSRPGRGCRSSTHTDSPRAAIARAEARPVTPAPMTATSISVIFFYGAGPHRRASRARAAALARNFQLLASLAQVSGALTMIASVVSAAQHASRRAGNDGAVGDVARDHGAGAHHRAGSNRYAAQDDG